MNNKYFVGREQELEFINNWSKTSDESLILNLFGIGGIGKTFFINKVTQTSSKSFAIIDFRLNENHFRENILKTISLKILNINEHKSFLRFFETAINGGDEANKGNEHSANVKVNIGNKNNIYGSININAKVEVHSPQNEANYENSISIITQNLISRIKNKSEHTITIVFDHCERIENDELLSKWLINHFGNIKYKLLLFLVGRKKIASDIPNKITQFTLSNLSIDDTKKYFLNFGINENQDLYYRISKGHPYCLFLLTDLISNNNIDVKAIPSEILDEKIREGLVAKFLTEQIIQNETDFNVKKALIYGTIFRFLNASNLAQILEIEVISASELLQKLENRAFIIKGGNYWLFHDILLELIKEYHKNIFSSSDYSALHRKAVKFYYDLRKNEKIDSRELLMSIVEPIYHLQEFDENKVKEYIENEYKTRLDRKEKEICQIMINQLNFSQISNNNIKAWLKFRVADFYREFGEYEIALDLYKSVIENDIRQNQIDDSKLLSSIYNNIGWVYLFYKNDINNQNAISFFEKSVDLCTNYKHHRILAMSYNNLGIAWDREDNGMKKAHDYYKKSLEITESSEFSSDLTMILTAAKSHQNLGINASKEKDYELALKEYNIAFNQYQRANSNYHVNQIAELYGDNLYEKRDYESSKNSYLFTIPYWQKTNNYLILSNTLFKIGLCSEKQDEFEDTIKAHGDLCIYSLIDSVDTHNYWIVHKIFPFINYLFIKGKLEKLDDYIKGIISNWCSQNNPYNSINQFHEAVEEHVKQIKSGNNYWLNLKDEIWIMHHKDCKLLKELTSDDLIIPIEKNVEKENILECEQCIKSIKPSR